MSANPYELFKNISAMKAKAEEAKKKIASLSVTGTSGGDMVQITVNGEWNVTDVTISSEAYAMGKDALPVLIKAAFQDARQKLSEATAEASKELFGDIDTSMLKGFV